MKEVVEEKDNEISKKKEKNEKYKAENNLLNEKVV